MADVKHCTASPINDFEGFLHIFYCRIKNFTESLTEKLLCQVGWQGRVQNNRNSPHDVRSLDCRVRTQTELASRCSVAGLSSSYTKVLPKFFLFSLLASWRTVVSFTVPVVLNFILFTFLTKINLYQISSSLLKDGYSEMFHHNCNVMCWTLQR